MAELRINDFSGGETDRYRDGQPNFAQRMRNLLVSENRRAESRPGYASLYTDDLPFGNQRCTMIWSHCTRQTASTYSTNPQILKYETFVISNGAVMVSNNEDTGWRTVTADDGSTIIPLNLNWPQSAQPNYTRLTDDEFVVTSITDTGGFSIYPLKFYRESSGGEWRYVSLGLPRYGSTIGTTQGVGGNDWIYALVLKHEYTTFQGGFLTKIVRGAPVFTDRLTSATSVEITVPAFTAANLISFDDAQGSALLSTRATFSYTDTVWEIYRTTDKGSVFYKLAEFSPAGGTYGPDSSSDSALVAGEKLYTTGGVLDNDMIARRPLFSTVANGALWMASSANVWQTKIGIYDAAPGSFVFSAKENEEITAISAIDVYPIVFTTKGVYRVEGLVDDLGNGTHRLRTISETDGALSNRTTVKAGAQIYYWANDGIWMTNGYTAAKVSRHYNDTYNDLVSRLGTASGKAIPAYRLAFGVWEKQARRVHWFLPESGGGYCRDTLTLDIKYKHDEGMCLTSGDVPYDTTDATSQDGNLHIVMNSGHILGNDPDNYSDLNVEDFTFAPKPQGIEWDYVSVSLAFGKTLARKWISRVLLHFTNFSDLTFRVYSDTDESGDYREHNAVRERGFARGLYFLKRWFPRRRLRATYKTMRFTNSILQALLKSDDYDTGSVTAIGSVSTFVLDSGVWTVPANYYLALEDDGYVARYLVVAESAGGDTITVQGALPAGSGKKWEIYGLPQDEKVEMNGYTLEFFGTGEGHTQSPTVEGGNV